MNLKNKFHEIKKVSSHSFSSKKIKEELDNETDAFMKIMSDVYIPMFENLSLKGKKTMLSTLKELQSNVSDVIRKYSN